MQRYYQPYGEFLREDFGRRPPDYHHAVWSMQNIGPNWHYRAGTYHFELARWLRNENARRAALKREG